MTIKQWIADRLRETPDADAEALVVECQKRFPHSAVSRHYVASLRRQFMAKEATDALVRRIAAMDPSEEDDAVQILCQIIADAQAIIGGSRP